MINHYLLPAQILKLEQASHALIEKNGWRDQMAVAYRILLENSIMINDFNMAKPSKKPSIYDITQGIVDILIVIQHPVDILRIPWTDVEKIAFNEYKIGGKTKEPKIARTHKRILNIENYQSTLCLKDELEILANKVIKQQQKTYNDEYGLIFQTKRACEELLELAAEISRYDRFYDTKGSRDCKDRGDADNRMAIIDEIYDVLFTLRYLLIKHNIKISDLQKHFDIRLTQVCLRELGR